MKQKIKSILFIVVFIAVVVGLFVYKHMASITKYNDTYVNGNTISNLYNSGMFCQYGDIIYFANPDDEFKLYSMDTSGENLKKINDDVPSYINADENYLYYVRDNGDDHTAFSFLNVDTNSLIRCNRNNGEKVKILDHAPSLYSALLGNYIYFIHYDEETASTLYRVKIDGTELSQVSSNPYYTCCTVGQYLYYSGMDNDHYLYRYDTETDSQSLVLTQNVWMPVVTGSYVYYMDIDEDYRLCRADLYNQTTEVLVEERIDCFQVYDNGIFYQTNQDPGLYRCTLSGGGQTLISSGNYTNLCVAGEYLYFSAFSDENTVYRVRLSGTKIDTFHPGTE